MASLTRIATNIGALNALDALNKVNAELAMRQMRLATGQRINSAKEDAAGWVIGKGMEARAKGLSQALSNVGDAEKHPELLEQAYNLGKQLGTVE